MLLEVGADPTNLHADSVGLSEPDCRSRQGELTKSVGSQMLVRRWPEGGQRAKLGVALRLLILVLSKFVGLVCIIILHLVTDHGGQVRSGRPSAPALM